MMSLGKAVNDDWAVPVSRLGEPAWEVACLFPSQGEWTEAEYLALATNHLVELSNGCLEVIPMPTHEHQMIVALLYGLLKSFADAQAPGTVLFAPLRVRLWPGKFREPDILYMAAAHAARMGEFWEGADLLMEVVGRGNPGHDRETKREEYARAGVPEYWIVDVLERCILVLTLDGGTHRVHGQFGPGAVATSALLRGFQVQVDQVLSLAAPIESR